MEEDRASHREGRPGPTRALRRGAGRHRGGEGLVLGRRDGVVEVPLLGGVAGLGEGGRRGREGGDQGGEGGSWRATVLLVVKSNGVAALAEGGRRGNEAWRIEDSAG